jgi:hypothetical protein
MIFGLFISGGPQGRVGARRSNPARPCGPPLKKSWLITLFWLFTTATALAQNSPPILLNTADLSGTDDLGRSLPTHAQTGGPKPNRYVGLFYWQWHTGLRATADVDMSVYLTTHPKQTFFSAFPPGGPAHPTFYWGQPVFGYYRSDDPWVIRKQLPLLADAGIDFLFLDYTNGSVYDKELATFLQVADDLKSKGTAVPRLTFFLNSQPEWKIEALYKTWYKPGKHNDAWFRFDGKPLLMAPMPTDAKKLKDPSLLPEIQKYFTFRPTWALERADKDKHLWRFLSKPENPPALGPDGKIEQMVVGKSMGGPIWNAMTEGGVSATFLPNAKPHAIAEYDNQWMLPNAAQGVFFQAEWNHAFEVAPPILLVTGWNEWTASVWEQPGVPMLGKPTAKGEGHIVDEFNPQFDRDLEPVRGSYGDDYYWQLVENVRRYKGMLPPQPVSPRKTIAVDAAASDWSAVTPVYHDTVGDIADRDWDSNVKGIHYTDRSARNDLAAAQVARDGNTVVFRITTAAPATAPAADNWMTLLIDTDDNPKTGWDGYDLLINRTRNGTTASVERHAVGGYTWTKVADAPIHIEGNAVTVAIPRALFPPGRLKFGFKWTDNLPPLPRWEDFYTTGDVAPDGRFNFRFEEPK